MHRLVMDSSVEAAVYYCCIFNGKEKLHSYNSGDHELDSLAELCLVNAPLFHVWYFHTMGKRTFGFLMEEGNTYFAITNSSLGNPEILQFLEHVRDGFKKAEKNGFQEELLPVMRRLIASLENVIWSTFTEQAPDRPSPNNGAISTKAPLLGKAISKHDRKKMKDRAIEARDDENHVDRGVKIDMPLESVGGISMQKSLSSSRARGQQVARRLWWRQVRIIIAVDVLLCLILFGIWLAVCNGFQCVSH